MYLHMHKMMAIVVIYSSIIYNRKRSETEMSIDMGLGLIIIHLCDEIPHSIIKHDKS